MIKGKQVQTEKKLPSFIHIDQSRGKILVNSLSPVVVMKKVKLRRPRGTELEFSTDIIPEIDEGAANSGSEKVTNEINEAERNNDQAILHENELSFIHTMTNEELNDHIQKCLEMSTENKITPKNAFALQLIDCMNMLMQKKEDFSTMACTLDAGTKIYSYRVDALHQQVMKLAEEVILNHKERKNKKNGGETDSDEREPKEKRRGANKKSVIASSESLRRKLKGKDPRDSYVKLAALPGAIISTCRRDAENLSFTLENKLKFWQIQIGYKPLKAEGTITLPEYKILRNNNKVTNFLETIHDKFASSMQTDHIKTDHTEVKIESQESFNTLNSPIDDSDHVENLEESIINAEDVIKVPDEEVGVISTAMKRLKEELNGCGGVTNTPSRFEAMKLIFNEASDYHYLDMKNAHFWAGPEFWKRPKGSIQTVKENINSKKKQKKEPRDITYEYEQLENKWNSMFKKNSNLTKRTVLGWKRNRLTLPANLKVEIKMFLDCFHISITNKTKNFQDSTSNEKSIGVTNESCQDSCSQEVADFMSSQNTLDNSFYEGVPDNPGSPENKDLLNSAFYDVGLFPRPVSSQCNNNGIEPAKVIRVDMDSTNTSTFDESSLVPAPKIIRYEPIKYSTRPIRVDMLHLKQTMIETIRQDIEQDKQDKGIWQDTAAPEAKFGDVLQKLPGKLERRTAHDLSPAMGTLALLMLANENNLQLKNSDDGDVVIRFEDDEMISDHFE